MITDHQFDPVAREGGLFDPVAKAEQALNDHAKEEHEGNTTATCATCRALSAELRTLAEQHQGVYRYSGEGNCRYCTAEILWFATPKNRQISVDRERLLEAWPALANPNALLGLWTTKARGAARLLPFTHWATCPEADRARKSHRRKQDLEGGL